jgi:exosortase
LIVGSGLWAYWPTLQEMADRWSHDPRYSHGFLVPAFSLYLLWMCRASRPGLAGSDWPGPALLGAAGVVGFLGAYCYISWLESIAFLITIAGLVALYGDGPALIWAGPALAFLIFMVPLPYRVETALGFPLQRLAIEASTFALQTFGLPAFCSGNTIVMDDFRIGVVDACNGLGASYTFLALSVAAAIMAPRPTLNRLLLIAAAIPIGLALNVARIVATALLHEFVGPRVADAVYHDLAGWIMLLLGLAVLAGECRLLAYLFTSIEDRRAAAGDRGVEPPAGRDQTDLEGRGPRAIAILAAVALILGAAVVKGPWTGRWRDPVERRLAVGRLERIPVTIGDWVGRPGTIDPRQIRAGELDGYAMRRYEDRTSGSAITLLVVCGRPGPVSVHGPEVCFPGVGFEMAQAQPETISVPTVAGGRAEFATALLERRAAVPPERMRVSWSWKGGRSWGVPYSPRLAFGAQPFLFKLYVIQWVGERAPSADDEALMDFLRRFVPVLDTALDDLEAAPPSR